MTTGWAKRVAGRMASDAVARMSLTTYESDGRRRTEENVSRTNSEDTTLTGADTMHVVMDLVSAGLDARPRRRAPAGSVPARVSRVDRGRLSVLTAEGESRVHPGAALYDESGLSGPAVGDWVALRGELAVAVLPRTAAFVRTVAGRTSAAQVVAANLDVVLVVDSLAGEARLRRVERYLAVAWSSGATPVVVLTKADLCDDVAAVVEQVRRGRPRRRGARRQLGDRRGRGRRPRAAAAGPDRGDGRPVRASGSPAS